MAAPSLRRLQESFADCQGKSRHIYLTPQEEFLSVAGGHRPGRIDSLCFTTSSRDFSDGENQVIAAGRLPTKAKPQTLRNQLFPAA
ncbi:hypothetical protein REMIM1_PF00346 (plasmid) [Rhizobium etli bv. mimosae str. Mim1]|nr:hypothetical protein REMIM1_PF00346 [Rhizobium etli bv. mimosae str. Mim1]